MILIRRPVKTYVRIQKRIASFKSLYDQGQINTIVYLEGMSNNFEGKTLSSNLMNRDFDSCFFCLAFQHYLLTCLKM